MRVLGIDYGERRLGLALSDASGMLASPWKMVPRPAAEPAAVALVTQLIHDLQRDDDGLQAVVVGWPRRLDGSATHMTAPTEAFADALRAAVSVPVALQDERLSSHEADARLIARGERDWKRRKARIDAEAAAIILQDYLDHRS
jgi:putative holliday junction resolvase